MLSGHANAQHIDLKVPLLRRGNISEDLKSILITHQIQYITVFCSSPPSIFKLSLQVPWIDSNMIIHLFDQAINAVSPQAARKLGYHKIKDSNPFIVQTNSTQQNYCVQSHNGCKSQMSLADVSSYINRGSVLPHKVKMQYLQI